MNTVEFQAIYVMWLRQTKRFIRARSRLIGNIVQPFFFLAIMGFGFNTARFASIPLNYSYIDFLSPGIIAMAVLFSSMFAGISVLWDKQFGFLQEVLVAPVSRLSIVIGRTLGGATTALIQGVFVLIISFVLGVKFSLNGLLQGLIFMVLIAFFSVGFGLIIASRMEDIHGFQLIMNLLIFPMFFLSSAFFPIKDLPNWLKALTYINPLTYGVDGLRGSLIGISYFPLLLDLTLTFLFAAATMIVGSYSFKKSEA